MNPTRQLDLRGVFGPVVTTFRSDEALDLEAFESNARAHIAAGLDGVVVTGSTGEAALLNIREREELIDAARAVVPSDKLLLVGTGAESTRTCVVQTRDAANRGADGVLVVAPHYYGSAMTDAALRQHYLRVADASPIPVILYSIPKYMHFALSPALVADLAQHENIVGIKDSSGQKDMMAAYLQSQSDTFTVLTGNAQLFQYSLTSGARGGILAAGLFAPEVTRAVYDAVGCGDTAGASAAQARLDPLGAKIVGALGIAGVKAAMDYVGLRGGVVRSPLLPLAAQQLEEVRAILART